MLGTTRRGLGRAAAAESTTTRAAGCVSQAACKEAHKPVCALARPEPEAVPDDADLVHGKRSSPLRRRRRGPVNRQADLAAGAGALRTACAGRAAARCHSPRTERRPGRAHAPARRAG